MFITAVSPQGESDAWQPGPHEDPRKTEQNKTEQTRRRIAYHLAGHVVLAHHVELSIGDITILPHGNHSGSCRISGSPCEWDACMMLLAGPVAERLVVERDDLGLILGNLEDWKSAEVEAERVFASYSDHDERQRLVQEFLQDARATVTALFAHPTLGSAVVRLADELLRHETVSGETARAIIEDSLAMNSSLGAGKAGSR